MRQGEGPMVTEDDARKVNQDSNMLKSGVFRLLADRHITAEQFTEMHRIYKQKVGVPARKIGSDRNNILRTLTTKKKITYKMYEDIVKNILGLNLMSFTVVYKDSDGKVLSLTIDRKTF